ncbi:MAG TPA: hypothetical protein VH370_17970 [Humisphaera sp.]|jgi:hypothetical protein|nr:hypothetical protein [Humisphaera sp.]
MRVILERRIRFLLPPIVAVGLMIGLAVMAVDFWATRQYWGLLWPTFLEFLLVVNIWIRRRCQVQLWRLTAGCCMACGYDLRATVDRCPECGAVASKPPAS